MKIAIEIDCGVTECGGCQRLGTNLSGISYCNLFQRYVTSKRQRPDDCLSAEALAKKEV